MKQSGTQLCSPLRLGLSGKRASCIDQRRVNTGDCRWLVSWCSEKQSRSQTVMKCFVPHTQSSVPVMNIPVMRNFAVCSSLVLISWFTWNLDGFFNVVRTSHACY